MSQHYSYVFLELGVLAGVALITVPSLARLRVRWTPLLIAVTGLFVFWCLVDWVAVALGLWRFPTGGTLPIRVQQLPAEEYLVFLVHSAICLFLAALFAPRQDAP